MEKVTLMLSYSARAFSYSARFFSCSARFFSYSALYHITPQPQSLRPEMLVMPRLAAEVDIQEVVEVVDGVGRERSLTAMKGQRAE